MFFLTYILSELRRRSGRTVLTALGLGLGVGLVVTVNALSAGLDQAQAKILEPLTGVGTDMSVTRPIDFSPSGDGGFPQLSDKERQQLEQENGRGRFGLRNLGNPGDKFSRDDFVSTAQLSFAASEVTKMAKLEGVASAAGGLTLNSIHIEGTVPKETEQPSGPQTFQNDQGGPQVQVGPRSVNATSLSVSGVDETNKSLGAITPGQVSSGRYFRSGDAREAILNESYASRENLGLGDTVKLGGKTFTVVGLAKTPLGGQSSDVYVKLSQLQALSDRVGRVNTAYVRADSADDVDSVASAIEGTLHGASVTTASDLASRVSGTLVDAKNLAGSLGKALVIVGLLAAFLIASLLTLSSVTKRVRELGTLKALGWSQRLVVRQVTGESLVQGLLGGAVGVVVGIAGALAITAFGPTLQATVDSVADQGPTFGGPFGQGAVSTPATDVALDAPVSVSTILWAVGLALLGGLVAGAVGSLRASRLRPADALRHID
jgi:putative ABC transport system permease protein